MMTEPGQRQRAERLARAALALYGLHDAEVGLLRHEFMQLFRVHSASQGEFALRLYGLLDAVRELPGDDPRLRSVAALRSPEVLYSQLLWLSALRRDTGLLVPYPVPTLAGEIVGEVTVEGTPWRRHSALLRWVPGVHKKPEDLTEADLLRVGLFLAGMHDHAEGYALPECAEFPRWDWHWPFGETALLWSEGRKFYSEEQMETFRQAARRVRELLDELGEGRDVFGLIHRDLNVRHVVFTGEGIGVIDFDLCGFGHYLFDLSVLRRSLRRVPEDRQGPLWEAFLRGYESVRPLPESIHTRLERYLGTFDVMQRVAAVNRRLELLGLHATEPETREKWLRFLRASPGWLRRWLRL